MAAARPPRGAPKTATPAACALPRAPSGQSASSAASPAHRSRLRHRDDANAARLRRTTDVVAERDRGVLHLPLLRLPLQLLVVLVDHAHAGGAGRVAEGLQPAVRVDR